jgi:hypothetical protein
LHQRRKIFGTRLTGIASTEQRRLNDERIDRELADLEAAKKEFYRGH